MAKKNDPNYKQLCGHVPKELFLDFKKVCLDRGVDQSEALETAIRQWISVDISVKFESILAKLELEQSEVITSLIAKWIEEQENEEKPK